MQEQIETTQGNERGILLLKQVALKLKFSTFYEQYNLGFVESICQKLTIEWYL